MRTYRGGIIDYHGELDITTDRIRDYTNLKKI
jgi:hypothetical protein